MSIRLDKIDERLLDGWQRDFPLESHPFKPIAEATGLTEENVIVRYRRLLAEGAISRIGATCRPNTVGASTLAAIAVPESRLEEVAALINEEPGVNHSYLREDEWNIWFVATGSDRDSVDASLARIEARSGLRVLDLRLLRPFNVDLGFALDGSGTGEKTRKTVDETVMLPGDREIMQSLSVGLDVVARPFAVLADQLGRAEAEVLDRVRVLAKAGLLSRVGVIVRHRALGWRSNAMVVWQVPEAEIETVGPLLMAVPGVTLCYHRRPVPDVWPYTLYCMVHARSRSEATAVLDVARAVPGLVGVEYKILFSTRCFKQRGALIAEKEVAA